MRVLRPKNLDELLGPVTPPAAGSNKLSATKALMRLLKETGIIAESFEAEAFRSEAQRDQTVSPMLVRTPGTSGRRARLSTEQPTQSKSTAIRSTLTVARSTPIVAPGDQTAASSPYVAATEEIESSDLKEPPRMT
ncbi:unnamed protein product [Phytophthora fragariaefolia]|uniref:Unnamed protein product n=1 Tax=Phytophthora fragariaefolia TaxID=1490495 RepID=A0A9W6XSH3_9STRA|nr:unnamed protein product [Phytophthora fragariaefolia]